MKKCFLACPIGPENSDIRMRSRFLMERIVQATIDRLGDPQLIVQRADQILSDGRNVMLKVIEEMQNCDFMIVDTTGDNPNVFFEMGIGMALEKPMIFLRSTNQCGFDSIPFDLMHLDFVKIPNAMTEYGHDFFQFESDLQAAQERLFLALKGIIKGNYSAPYGKIRPSQSVDGDQNEALKELLDENINLKSALSELKLMISNSKGTGIRELAEQYIKKLQGSVEDKNARDLLLKSFSICSQLESELNDQSMALALYEEMLKHDHANISILYNIARLHYSIGKSPDGHMDQERHNKNAVEYLEKALDISPGFERAEKLLKAIKQNS